MAAWNGSPEDKRRDEDDAELPSDVNPSPHKSGAQLGEREREVMSVLWAQGEANVQQVASRLSANLAYTTVMTTLDRLFKKGFLLREKKERAFIYTASVTPEEMERKRANQLIQRFFSHSDEQQDTLISCLVNAVHQYDAKLLDQLESEIRSARTRTKAPKYQPGRR
jgi:predicted transcriptional regulator